MENLKSVLPAVEEVGKELSIVLQQLANTGFRYVQERDSLDKLPLSLAWVFLDDFDRRDAI